MRLIIAIILFASASTIQAQTWNNQTLSNYVRTLQSQASATITKNSAQDATLSTLTTKVNSQANIITIQNSTIATLQTQIATLRTAVDAIVQNQKSWRPTWMNPNDFKVINGPTTDSVSTVR